MNTDQSCQHTELKWDKHYFCVEIHVDSFYITATGAKSTNTHTRTLSAIVLCRLGKKEAFDALRLEKISFKWYFNFTWIASWVAMLRLNCNKIVPMIMLLWPELKWYLNRYVWKMLQCTISNVELNCIWCSRAVGCKVKIAILSWSDWANLKEKIFQFCFTNNVFFSQNSSHFDCLASVRIKHLQIH